MHRLAEENRLGWLGVGGLTGHVNAPHNSLFEEGYVSMNANDLQIGDLLAQKLPINFRSISGRMPGKKRN